MKSIFTRLSKLGLLISLFCLLVTQTPRSSSAQSMNSPGALTVVDSNGAAKAVCPLKHTDVRAEISGSLSRVVVTQSFENPFNDKIEAVYTFPLPHDAAVDDMTMAIGDRTIKGKILPREEAQASYEEAKASGRVASLLDQERPNIFTQSVANILPGAKVTITISYVETLSYDSGTYQFVFPMVVGPRYIPGNAVQEKGNGFAPNTDRVPDASRITPEPMPNGQRAGHDISLDIRLDAGVIIDSLNCTTHPVAIERPDPRSAHVSLKDSATIPNKDFVLRYDVANQSIQDALLTHRNETGGYFTLILQPPDRVKVDTVTPKELVFVLDTSGSMQGFPIEKAKETMKLALDNLNPADTFNLITFSGDTHILFPEPVAATKENLRKAQQFLASSYSSGGTEMMKAIKTALDPSDSQKHVRVVCFMTDGYVGNDFEIINEVQKHPNARVFAFGIGSSVNRFLLDNMASAGRGEVEYVGLNDDGSAAARRFHERVRSPLLTDISVDWNGLPVADVYPRRIPDLFSAKPVVLYGRFTGPAQGTIKLKGKVAGADFVREIPVSFPETMALHDVLAPLWARQRVNDLMGQDLAGAQAQNMSPELKQTITQLGLEYRLMTQFTSFVAVEEMVVTDGGQPRRVDVPIESPEGVTVVAEGDAMTIARQQGLAQMPMAAASVVVSPSPMVARRAKTKSVSNQAGNSGTGSGVGGGGGGGYGIVTKSGTGTIRADVSADDRPLNPAEAELEAVRAKVHPTAFGIIVRLKKNNLVPDATESKFVKDGKAELQIWLKDKSEATMNVLKDLGVEIVANPSSSKLIIGRLDIAKLEALAKLDFVRYVSPQFSK